MTMRQFYLLSAAAGIGALVAAAPAMAADAPAPAAPAPPAAPVAKSVPFDLAFGVKFTTNYVFRGISQSNRKPAPQAYVEAQFFDNLFYINAFYSKVDLVTRPPAETDIAVGIRPKLGPLSFDIGYQFYGYPNERRLLNPYAPVTYDTGGGVFDGAAVLSPRNTDFAEVHGAVSGDVGDFTLGAGVWHAWNWLGTGAPATYVNGTAKYKIPETVTAAAFPGGISISGELGYYDLGRTAINYGAIKLKSYTTWNVGAAYNYKNLTVDLRYSDTNLSKKNCFVNTSDPAGFARGTGRSSWCGATFLATVSLDFTMSGLQQALAR